MGPEPSSTRHGGGRSWQSHNWGDTLEHHELYSAFTRRTRLPREQTLMLYTVLIFEIRDMKARTSRSVVRIYCQLLGLSGNHSTDT